MASNDPQPADSPFNDLFTSNVVLHTSDGLDFHVHKHILSMASSFFEGMFSLDEPPSADSQCPIIDVSERSEVIEAVLRLCYPVDEPDLSSLAKIVGILGAAHKYEMKTVKRRLQIPLRQLLDTYPLQVFAHACSYRLEETAVAAATVWKAMCSNGHNVVPTMPWDQTPPGRSYVPEMEEIPSGMFFRLLSYVRTAAVPASFFDHTGMESSGPSCDPVLSQIPSYSHVSLCQRLSINPDVTVHAIDGTKYSAHRVVLAMASETLMDVVKKGGGEGVIYFTENSQTLAMVLRACYPGMGTSKMCMSVSLATSVLGAARKYALSDLEVEAKRNLEEHIRSKPLEVYLHVASLGWKEGARAAAVQLSRMSITELYTPTMETTPARFYYALLKFHFDYRSALIDTVQSGHTHRTRPASVDEFRHDWLWQDTAKIFPELILAAGISQGMNDSCYIGNYHHCNHRGFQTPTHHIFDRFGNLNTSLLNALRQVELDIAWGDDAF